MKLQLSLLTASLLFATSAQANSVDINVTGTITGAPGATYILHRSISMQAGSWIDVDTEVAPASGNVTVVDSDPPDGRAFYRLSYTD